MDGLASGANKDKPVRMTGQRDIRSVCRWLILCYSLLNSSILHSAQPSFDCSIASGAVERLICSDTELSKTDANLDEMLKATIAKLPDDAKPFLRDAQTDWVKERNKCPPSGFFRISFRDCISRSYDKRFAELHYVLANHNIAPEREYSALMTVAGNQITRENTKHGFPDRTDIIDVSGCTYPAETEGFDPAKGIVEDVIFIYLVMQDTKRLRIYQEIKPLVDVLRQDIINTIKEAHFRGIPDYSRPSGAYQKLRVHKEELVTAANKRLGRTRYEDDHACGAGEVSVMLKPDPSDAKVSIINSFRFALCRARKIDPWNRNTCFGWREAVGASLELAGTYRYQIFKSDGSISKGQFQISEETLSDGQPHILSLR